MNNHLTHQQLLAYLDGELPRAQRLRAKEHLHSCWTCRIAMERLESDIATILDAQNESFSPLLPPPPRPWPGFDALLARSLPLPPAPLWTAYLRSLLSPARVLMVSGVAAILLVFVYSAFRPKPVSAKEVLRQVRIADTKRSSITKEQVIRERVHIRESARGRSHPQLTHIDTWKSPTAAYWNVPDSVAADLAEHYKAHAIPLDLPLSAAAVDSWGQAAGGNPTVSQQGSDVDLSFAGSSDRTDASVERVSLVIQPETWQVKRMTLEFPDASFEVTEDDFSVVPTSAVPPELLAHLEPQLPPQMAVRHAVHPFSASAAGEIHLPMVDLDSAELDVFATLHRLHADLGEPVTVARSAREVQVGVWQLPADRQNVLRAALEGKPGVQVELTEPMRTAAAQAAIPPPATAASPPLQITVDAGGDDQRLFQFFGSVEKDEEFTTQALAASTAILSHLYALRNLQGQFPPEREQTLAPGERAQLTALVQDHAEAIAANLAALQSQLAPLDAAFHIAASQDELSAHPALIHWQSQSLDALETAKAADHLLRALFTTSQTPATPDSALPQIAQNLARLSAELKNLSPAVDKVDQ